MSAEDPRENVMSLNRRSTLKFWGVSLFATGVLPTGIAEAAGDELKIAYPTDVPNWDPQTQTSGPAMSILNCVFDSRSAKRPTGPDPPRRQGMAMVRRQNGARGEAARRRSRFHNSDKYRATASSPSTTTRRRRSAERHLYRRVKDVIAKSDTEATFDPPLPFATLPPDHRSSAARSSPRPTAKRVGT